jgi:hypothetical protein
MHTQQLTTQYCHSTIVEQQFDAFLMTLNDKDFNVYTQACEEYMKFYRVHMTILAQTNIDLFTKEFDENVNRKSAFKSYIKELKAHELEQIAYNLF